MDRFEGCFRVPERLVGQTIKKMKIEQQSLLKQSLLKNLKCETIFNLKKPSNGTGLSVLSIGSSVRMF